MALLTEGDFKGHFIITAYFCWIPAAVGWGVGGDLARHGWGSEHGAGARAICKCLAVKVCRELYSITPAEFCRRENHPSNCTPGIRMPAAAIFQQPHLQWLE